MNRRTFLAAAGAAAASALAGCGADAPKDAHQAGVDRIELGDETVTINGWYGYNCHSGQSQTMQIRVQVLTGDEPSESKATLAAETTIKRRPKTCGEEYSFALTFERPEETPIRARADVEKVMGERPEGVD